MSSEPRKENRKVPAEDHEPWPQPQPRIIATVAITLNEADEIITLKDVILRERGRGIRGGARRIQWGFERCLAGP